MKKRSDITTLQVLDVYSRPFSERYPAEKVLAHETGAPEKVCWAAMVREDERGFLDYGSNLRGGWLTPLGAAKLKELKENEE
jgi:hypothetical protein